jgi:hypothetical protein
MPGAADEQQTPALSQKALMYALRAGEWIELERPGALSGTVPDSGAGPGGV